jgi:hypothetical protein
MSRFSSLVIHGRSFTQTLRERSGTVISNHAVMLSISSVNISNFSSAVRATDDRASHGIFIAYILGARGIRRNISRSDDIITEGNISTNPPRGWSTYKWYITPKVKVPTKFRINYKICWILAKRIQFLIFYLYLSFWRFLIKIFEHVSSGSLKVT